MTDRIGQRLGNYTIVQLLGQGGFAEVYLGEHVYLKTPAAVKVLQARLSGSDDMDSFLKEAQMIARLVHPHIVRVMDFGIDSEIPFLVMDYAPNGTLRQRHRKETRLPLPTIVPYVRQLADALQYAHDEKLIHRDIKPENMLLGRHHEVLLSDFGIALIAQSSRYQSTQDVVGTVAYMAPEQIQGKPRPASDQYSLGIVVYEWLCGRRPFRGSFTELCTQHMFAPPPPLREQDASISPDVEQVVMAALAKEPKQRFGSVQAFANALEQASKAATEPPSSRPAQPRIDQPAQPQVKQVILSQLAPSAQPQQETPALQPPPLPTPQPSTKSAEVQPIPPTQLATPAPATDTVLPVGNNPVIPSSDQHSIPVEKPGERVKVWNIGKRQVIAMIVGTLLYGSVSHFFILSPIPPVDREILPGLAILLFFGVVFGPWVGLITGAAGFLIGNYLHAHILFFIPPWDMGFLTTVSTIIWNETVSIALLGFIAGLTIPITRGRYTSFRSILIADIIGALAIIIGVCSIPVLRGIASLTGAFFTNIALPTAVVTVLLLSILLLIYGKITARSKA